MKTLTRSHISKRISPQKAVYKTNNIRHIESEIKQYGYAYCYNQTLVEELKKKGYIVDGDMVIKNGSL